MTVEGHFENGHVVLNVPINLPDGTKVTVSVQADGGEIVSQEQYPSLYERMKPVAGKAKGLPADLAINHDHYLHGQPRRQ